MTHTSRVHPSETAPPAENAVRIPTRDWRAIPAIPERVRKMANMLRSERGHNAAPSVRKWMRQSPNETHAGIGITLVDLLAEIESLDAIGVKPERVQLKMRRYTEKEISEDVA